jgi:hypothetical protein
VGTLFSVRGLLDVQESLSQAVEEGASDAAGGAESDASTAGAGAASRT